MVTTVQIDAALFHSRLERLYTEWSGNVELAAECQTWLLGYEFPETIMLIGRNPKRIAFLTSQKKGAILEALKQRPGPITIEIFKRATKDSSTNNDQLFEQFWKSINTAATAIGHLPKDKAEGPLLVGWQRWFEQQRLVGQKLGLIDISSALVSPALAVKDVEQIGQARIAAQMSALVMERHVMQKVLRVIDEGKRVPHSRLSGEIEEFIVETAGSKWADEFRGVASYSADLFDICYQPIIQSGGTYSLKPSAISTDQPLKGDVVVLALGIRYRSVCANVARTLLIDPTPEQEANLARLIELRGSLLAALRPGIALNALYQQIHDRVAQEWPELTKHLTPTLGFGMGLEFREADWQISPKCPRLVQAGMVFNLAIGFQDLSAAGNSVYSLFIADTVVVEAADEATRLLTDCLDKTGDLVYSLKEKNQQRRNNTDAGESLLDRAISSGTVLRTRLRTQQQVDAGVEKRRKEHQRELLRLRNKEALERFSADGASGAGKKRAEVVKFESYRKEAQMPRDQLKEQQIFVDKRNESVILPIYGLPVPFHIGTIKNVTKSDEGDFTLLRFNFNTPGRGGGVGRKEGSEDVAAAAAPNTMADPQAHYLRGITLRNPDAFRMMEVYKDIQDLRKAVAEREAARKEMSDLVEQAQLVELQSKRPPRLADIYLRPVLESKRLPGDVEIHQNGLRYKTQLKSDQRVGNRRRMRKMAR